MNTRSFRAFRASYEIQGDPDDSYFMALPDHDLGALANYLYRLVATKDIHISLDIGANIGLSTLLIAEACPGSKVTAFEPTPSAYRHLTANVDRAAGWKQISLQPLAVGDQVGTAKFKDKPGSSHQNHVLMSGNGIDVTITTVDTFSELHSLPKVDFIKIDVEGFELAVLHGAVKTLLRHRPTIFFEFNEHAIVSHTGMDPRDYFSQVKRTLGLLAVVDPLNGDTTPLPLDEDDALDFLRARMKTAEDVFDLVNQAV